ncbi:MAG TPA: hypothetical protein VFX17_02915 [Patescibacteria group bacterium]|nr:hypothetical protein [Patescibacteria group bacterium]
MSEFEQQKTDLASQVRGLCAHCSNGVDHSCKIKTLAEQITSLSGVPLIVNNRFNGLLFTN